MISPKRSSVLGSLAACAALLFAAPMAYAHPTGDNITCSQVGGGDFNCYPPTNTAGTGTTFTVGPSSTDPYIDVVFSASEMTLSFAQNANLSNSILDFSDTTTPWLSYALLSQSGMTGFNASDLSLTNGVFQVDLRGTTNVAGNNFTVAFGATPEPGSLALLGTGMLAMVELVRRRQRIQ